jgi:hypothetical protein
LELCIREGITAQRLDLVVLPFLRCLYDRLEIICLIHLSIHPWPPRLLEFCLRRVFRLGIIRDVILVEIDGWSESLALRLRSLHEVLEIVLCDLIHGLERVYE